MKKTKPVRKNKSKIENNAMNTFIKVQIFAVISYVFVFIIGSLIALGADLPRKYEYIYSLIMFAVSSFSVGFYSGLKLRQDGLVSGVIYSLPLNIIIILISLIINEFTVGMSLIITSAVLLLSAGIGGILAVNKRLRR